MQRPELEESEGAAPGRDADTLRAAVVGVGAFGRHHARIYSELSEQGIELIGLVDSGGEIAQEVATRLEVPLVARVADLPVRPDLVSVAVSTTQHRAAAEPLLRDGIHCLIEKPLAQSSGDARALIEAAAAGGAHLHVGHVERFNPALRALDAFEERPLFIEMQRLAPYRQRARDVGVVMDLMIHDLDILSDLLGEEAADPESGAIQAQTRTDHGGAEDVCAARIGWSSGCIARVVASRVARERRREIRIFGRDSYLRVDLDAGEAEVAHGLAGKDWSRQVAQLQGLPLSSPAGELGAACRPDLGEVETQGLVLGDAEPLRAELEALISAVRGRPSRGVEGREGLRALRLAERILSEADFRSGRTGL